MPRPSPPTVSLEAARRLWLNRQGLARPRGTERLTRRRFAALLERTGGLQLDTVNAVDRAHYLTLWSRFGPFDRRQVDRWVGPGGVAFEYWGHEASIRPLAHLPLARRRMRRFPGPWKRRSWWPRYETGSGSKRRVLRRLREEGPLMSADFERTGADRCDKAFHWGAMQLPKEDKRSLKLLWHDGRVAVRERRHFHCVYDLAERVYPEGEPATPTAYEDSWLLLGLSGNGVASEKHLVNYMTAPELDAATRRRVIARCLQAGRVVEVRVEGRAETYLALPEHVEELEKLDRGTSSRLVEPHGTTLVSPFDSLLWQRGRAEAWLDFEYRIEIYVPAKKRRFGYYVLPILHDGRLVGRLDPKLHREEGHLEIRGLWLEEGFEPHAEFRSGLRGALEDLAGFLGAERWSVPRPWGRRLRT